MQDIARLRSAIVGLIGFAALEEELLLARTGATASEGGSPQKWAAVPLVVHNSQFRHQQVERLDAIQRDEEPSTFAEIDHTSEETYRSCCAATVSEALEQSRLTSRAIVDRLAATSDSDLLDPSRHPWLGGRMLWLQIVVRGFWHPTGHLGEYYLAHEQAPRALALQSQASAFAEYVGAPDMAQGMADYNLACAQARCDLVDKALLTLRKAVRLNRDLVANVRRDADLEGLRRGGQLDVLLAANVPGPPP
jgi:hypothetical protein